jgi:hypothetical protein
MTEEKKQLDEIEFDENHPFYNVGMTFTFDPETLEDVQKKGRDFRGEYGSYKILTSAETGDPKHLKGTKKYSAIICIITDKLLPIALIHSLKIDAVYSIYIHTFKLDMNWMKKGEVLMMKSFHPEGKKLGVELYHSSNAKELPALFEKAIQYAIDYAEEQLKESSEESFS